MNQIYTVKETAKILGFSTNTVYKYLNEGRLKAARGELEQGRFRIPHQSIEEFLGTEIPTDIMDHIRSTQTQQSQIMGPESPVLPAYQSAPPTLPISASRILIVCALIGIIADIIISPSISLIGQISRIAVVGVFILLSYQNINQKPPDYVKPLEPNITESSN